LKKIVEYPSILLWLATALCIRFSVILGIV